MAVSDDAPTLPYTSLHRCPAYACRCAVATALVAECYTSAMLVTLVVCGGPLAFSN